MDDLLQGLTPQQTAAATHLQGPCLVIAGAGTGKTTVVTRRIAWLIQEQAVPPEQILALTFTDKAALEMEERVDTLLPYGVFGTTLSTFHSFCAEILRRHAYLLGIAADFLIMTPADEIAFLRQHLDDLPETTLLLPHHQSGEVLKRVIQFSQKAKEEILLPEVILAHNQQQLETAQSSSQPDAAAQIEAAQILAEYARLYQASRQLYHQFSVLSYSDLLLESLLLLRNHPSVLQEEATRFQYVMVDEFQDTNSAQHEIARLLTHQHQNLFVVGDDDQAIYQFRGANISNILHFRSHYPECRLITLLDNFRSQQSILDAAHTLIQYNNPERLEVKEKINKQLIAHHAPTAETALQQLHFQHCSQEYEYIAEQIEKHIASQQYQAKDIAILVRARSHGYALQKVLENKGITVQYAAENKFYALTSVQTALAYLRFLAAPHSTHNLFFLLTHPPFNQALGPLSQLMQEATYHSHSLYAYGLEKTEVNPPELNRWLQYLEQQLASASSASPSQLLLAFMHSSGWYQQLIEQDNQTDTEQIATLFQEIQHFEQLHPQAHLTEYIEHTDRIIESNEDITLTQNIDDRQDGVRLLTIHKSKGLEFPIVFLTNLIQGRFPSNNHAEGIPFPYELTDLPLQDKSNALAEERRLMYVAMTRAKDLLYLTSSEQYEERKTKSKLSLFVKEALNLDLEPASTAYKVKYPLQSLPTPDSSSALPSFTFPDHLSASALECYERCPVQYKYQYLLQIKTPDSSEANFGTSLHATLRAWYTALNQATPPNLGELYQQAWVKGGYETLAKERAAYQRGLKQVTAYLASPLAAAQPLFLEQSIRVKLENGFIITGKIDRVDLLSQEPHSHTVRLIDYKTGDQPPSESKLKQNLPLKIYALYLQKAGYTVQEAGLHYITVPQAVMTAPSQLQLDQLEPTLNELLQQIRANTEHNSFQAKPNRFLCDNCSYKNSCPFRAM